MKKWGKVRKMPNKYESKEDLENNKKVICILHEVVQKCCDECIVRPMCHIGQQECGLPVIRNCCKDLLVLANQLVEEAGLSYWLKK